MGKYSRMGDQRRSEERPWTIHPVWRGLGCLLLALVVIMSYAGAIMMHKANLIPMFPPLDGSYTVPANVIVPWSGAIIPMPIHGTIYYPQVFFFVIFTFIGLGLLTLIYSFLYRLFGPPRYNRFDSAPVRTQKRRKY